MELRKVADSQERPEGAEDTEICINEYALSNPATRSWEVPRDKVIIDRVIGQGSFGEVAQGIVSELQGREGTTKVAIKRLKGNTLHCNSLLSILHQKLLTNDANTLIG